MSSSYFNGNFKLLVRLVGSQDKLSVLLNRNLSQPKISSICRGKGPLYEHEIRCIEQHLSLQVGSLETKSFVLNNIKVLRQVIQLKQKLSELLKELHKK